MSNADANGEEDDYDEDEEDDEIRSGDEYVQPYQHRSELRPSLLEVEASATVIELKDPSDGLRRLHSILKLALIYSANAA